MNRTLMTILVAAVLTGCSASHEQVDRTAAAPPPVVVEHERRQVIMQPPVYVTPPTVTRQSTSTYQSNGAVSGDYENGTRSEHTYRHSESSTVQPTYPAPQNLPDEDN